MVSFAGTLIPGLNSSNAGFLRESTIVLWLACKSVPPVTTGRAAFQFTKLERMKAINFVKSCYILSILSIKFTELREMCYRFKFFLSRSYNFKY